MKIMTVTEALNIALVDWIAERPISRLCLSTMDEANTVAHIVNDSFVPGMWDQAVVTELNGRFFIDVVKITMD